MQRQRRAQCPICWPSKVEGDWESEGEHDSGERLCAVTDTVRIRTIDGMCECETCVLRL